MKNYYILTENGYFIEEYPPNWLHENGTLTFGQIFSNSVKKMAYAKAKMWCKNNKENINCIKKLNFV